MSKSLVNAVLSLRAKGQTKHEIRQLVETLLDVTFITWHNVRDHLDQIVSEMPGWAVDDRVSNTIKNSNGQMIWFGPAINGGMSVCQKSGAYVKDSFRPAGFVTKSPIMIDDLVEKINKLELAPPG